MTSRTSFDDGKSSAPAVSGGWIVTRSSVSPSGPVRCSAIARILSSARPCNTAASRGVRVRPVRKTAVWPIQQGLPDQRPQPELRVIQAAGHRQADVDDPSGVSHQGNSQVQGKTHGIGALHSRPQLQRVDHDLGVRSRISYDLFLQKAAFFSVISPEAGDEIRPVAVRDRHQGVPRRHQVMTISKIL